MNDFPDSLPDGNRSFRDGRYGRERDRYRSLAEHGSNAPRSECHQASISRSPLGSGTGSPNSRAVSIQSSIA